MVLLELIAMFLTCHPLQQNQVLLKLVRKKQFVLFVLSLTGIGHGYWVLHARFGQPGMLLCTGYQRLGMCTRGWALGTREAGGRLEGGRRPT